MTKIIVLTLSSTMNMNFIKMNHPMSMMFIIIIQTLFIGMIIGNLMESFWLSYILFLTFIGGMLVLFIYITSIASNELFNIKINNWIMNSSFMILLFLFFLILDFTIMMDNFKNSDTKMFSKNFTFQEMSISLYKLYNNPTFMITIIMMMYLFLTLLVVVKITNIYKGPMRKMN
uniref:NADH dehydrogenase subunit 6 n=1 Tax=Aularches miliaris TaxID=247159 RepID=UPI00286ADEFB|nr:NADH dehydrogenase subunit 6 [Aularches miliaris]WLG65253.1 NADH dehydrogenase subunit 6 [Aularches miliaris]